MKFWIKVTVLERNGRFLISSLVATHSINTNRKSTTRFSMSPRWTSYVVHKPPKGWLKNAKCPKFEQQAAITRKRYEIGCQLLLITNSKSHTGFRLVPTSMTWMTLNAVIALILCFFSPNSTYFQAEYITVVEDTPIRSVKYCLPVSVFHFWPKLTHFAPRSLCDSWATCEYTNNAQTL